MTKPVVTSRPMRLPDRLRLPFTFDPALLLRDLQSLSTIQWIDHFVLQNYDGEWSVIPLRAKAGARHPVMMISSDPSARCFEDTPMLAGCPYFREVLATFKCPLLTVRLMQLTSGSVIKEHSDYDLNFEDGTVRLHIPVTTNPDVDFRLNERRVVMAAGSSWYLRLSDPHSVANRGATSRVHLVIDAVADDWTGAILTEAAVANDVEAMAADIGQPDRDLQTASPQEATLVTAETTRLHALDRFCAMVLEDEALHGRLRGPDDTEAFVALVVDMGKHHGFRFTAHDVRSAMGQTSRVFAARTMIA
jgi:Aspartyl/Asparaginyl beta-hydroxylase/Nif11 domain